MLFWLWRSIVWAFYSLGLRHPELVAHNPETWSRSSDNIFALNQQENTILLRIDDYSIALDAAQMS